MTSSSISQSESGSSSSPSCPVKTNVSISSPNGLLAPAPPGRLRLPANFLRCSASQAASAASRSASVAFGSKSAFALLSSILSETSSIFGASNVFSNGANAPATSRGFGSGNSNKMMNGTHAKAAMTPKTMTAPLTPAALTRFCFQLFTFSEENQES